MAQRWSHSAISRSIVILRTKNRCLRTRLKINASQTIPRSSNLYIVEGHEWRGGKKTIVEERIVPNIASDKWKAIARTQARTRDMAIPLSRKGNNEQKANARLHKLSPTSRTRWSILEKSDNKRLAGYKLFNCSILAKEFLDDELTRLLTRYIAALPQGYWGFFVNRFLSVRRNFFSFLWRGIEIWIFFVILEYSEKINLYCNFRIFLWMIGTFDILFWDSISFSFFFLWREIERIWIFFSFLFSKRFDKQSWKWNKRGLYYSMNLDFSQRIFIIKIY